jgi:hypothetical protein
MKTSKVNIMLTDSPIMHNFNSSEMYVQENPRNHAVVAVFRSKLVPTSEHSDTSVPH